jgi:hypothetical protein
LPAWDGKTESLVDAAKTVLAVPPPKPTPGASRTGRAHIPNGYILTGDATPPADERREDQYGSPLGMTARQFAHFTGYWLPKIATRSGDWQDEWNAAQVPWYFKRGEPLPDLAEHIPPGYGSVAWYYEGQPEREPQPLRPPFVRAGLVREVVTSGRPLICSAGRRCPQTGIWDASALPEHPMHKMFVSQWWRQGYFEEGALLPDARAWGIEAEGQLVWTLVEPGAWPMDLPA